MESSLVQCTEPDTKGQRSLQKSYLNVTTNSTSHHLNLFGEFYIFYQQENNILPVLSNCLPVLYECTTLSFSVTICQFRKETPNIFGEQNQY